MSRGVWSYGQVHMRNQPITLGDYSTSGVRLVGADKLRSESGVSGKLRSITKGAWRARDGVNQ